MAGYIGAKVGTVTANAADIKGDISATDTTPEITLKNTTETDADGSRGGKIIFKGEQSGGEESTLANIQASHDGAADDEKGDLIFRTNDGSDGASPTERLRIDSAGTALFAEDIELVQTKNINFKHQAGGTLRGKISADGSDNLTFGTGSSGTERMRIDTNGKVGIGGGTDAAQGKLDVRGAIVTSNSTSSYWSLDRDDTTGNFTINDSGSNVRAQIDTYGNFAVGGVPAPSATNYNSATIHVRQAATSSVGAQFRLTTGGSGHGTGDGSFISHWADNDLYITNQENAKINFTTNGAQRMSLLNNGFLDNKHAFVATASTTQNTGFYNSGNGLGLYARHSYSSCGDHMEIGCDATDGWANIYLHREWGTGEDGRQISFNVNQSNVGTITTTTTGTAYNTSSDHRLKENVTNVTDGITRVKQLAPKRFNFIADADKTVDGFLAHEAQTVVPEAVTGTHNEVDEDGNPVMQQIDQAKLVPLLTAALQEAIAKIETLETKVAALEAE